MEFPKIKILAVYKNMGIVFYNSELLLDNEIKQLIFKYFEKEGKIFSFLPEYFLVQLLYFASLENNELSRSIKNSLALNFKDDFKFNNEIFKYQEEFITLLNQVNEFYDHYVGIEKLHNYYQDRNVLVSIKITKELFGL